MNAYMNINVRVLSANARAQIAALQAQIGSLQKQLAAANATTAAPGAIGSPRHRKSLVALGSQAQWTGRQLQMNLTLPLLLAGGAATKFALDNEKAFTRVKKVYGDTQEAAAQFNREAGRAADAPEGFAKANQVFTNELNALSEAFEALSSRYGVAQKEVLETAGAWAAAGVSGRELAESTELSIKAAILGDMELAKATESLISVQAQYSLTTKELGLALADLNAIENQTAVSMAGLIDGFTRSAGVAREAGIDVRHLGAMMAALVPATGSASTAGNALKTIISRLMSPTKDSADVMREFGVNTADAAWQASTAVERLDILAAHMGDSLQKAGKDSYILSDSQKQVVASVLGSRYQMNRFLVLMREMDSEMGYYQKALDATVDNNKVFAQAQKELDAVLESSPRRLQIMWTTLQNGMADAIQPMIPYIIYLAQSVARMVQKFNELDPSTQKLILLFLVFLTLVGPLIRYFSSLLVLVGAIAIPFKVLSKAMSGFLVVTKMVDGVLITTRRSFIGWIASMIAAPFKSIFLKLSGLLAWLYRITRAFVTAPLVVAATSKVWAAAGAAISLAFTKGSALMLAGWRAIWIAMTVIHTQGVARLVKTWVVGLALMLKSTMLFSKIGMIFSSAFAAISVLFSRQMFMPLIMGMVRLTNTIAYAWTGMWIALRGITVAGGAAVSSAFFAFRITFLAGWTGIYMGIVAIHSFFQKIILAGWAAMTAGIAAISAAGSSAIKAVWAAMHAALMLMSTAFWTGVIRLWFAAALMLPKALLVAKRGLQAAWAAIIALQRAGALAAALAAAGPWIAAGAVIVGAIVLLRDEIVAVWNNIVSYFSDSSNEMTQLVLRAWNALPQGVANALTAVARVVRDVALEIYSWFSYINPFARHSPSLVENVTNGMRIVGDQFGLAAGVIKNHVRGAYSEIKAFGKAVAGLLKGAASFEEAQQRTKIKKFAPGALDEFNKLAARLKVLKRDLEGLQSRLDKQQGVVDRWADRVEAANKKLDAQKKKLDELTKVQQKWQDLLSAAEDRLDKFASAPIIGMGAMSDAIFENEMAQKQLRLEMMRMEEVSGPLDDIRSKIEAINGAQEMLRGEQAALRSAGAGSEILSQYDAEIAALEATKKAQTDAAGAISDMSDALDELQRKGEMLDLENSLKFDPLTRQIEQAANAMEEMPFDKIIAGVTAAASDIAYYQSKLDDASSAVDRQQAVVDKLTEARDLLQESLDRESEKLDRIRDLYDEVSDAIRAVESTMNDAAGAAETLGRKAEEAAKKAKESVSPAVQNFRDAAGGNFANVGGDGMPIRTDWSDATKDIEEFTRSISDGASQAFSKINPFEAIKKKWVQFEAWFKEKFAPLGNAISDMFSAAFGGINFGSAFDSIQVFFAKVSDWGQSLLDGPLGKVWDLFGDDIVRFGREAWTGLQDMFGKIWDALVNFVEEFKSWGPALRGFLNLVKVLVGAIAAVLGPVIKVIIDVASRVIGPILSMIGDVVANIIQVVEGVFQIIGGFFMLFTSDWKAGLKKMGEGVLNIFGGLLGAIGGLFKGAFKTVVGFFMGIVDGIVDAALWLWDVMVGHSIIPDLINGIITWFKRLIDIVQWLWSTIVNPILGVFRFLFNAVIAAVKLWWTGITIAWAVLSTLAVWLWDNVLKPVWDVVVFLWNNAVKPALAAWWAGIKVAWAVLKTAGKWIWNNVLSPVFEKVKELWKVAKASFSAWWAGIKRVWNALKSAGKWIWDNVLSPVFSKVKDVWVDVKASLGGWWEGIKKVWKSLTGLGKWVYDNVMKPVFNRITGVWTDIKNWLVDNKDILTKPVRSVVNVVIGAVNAIIKGLNKVADILPGIDWDINTIPKLAQGGNPLTRRVGSGFKTNGARAIVGEGKANWPEYVIPTDPTHRQRATSLLLSAASKLGVIPGGDKSDVARLSKSPLDFYNGVPAYGIGGVLGDAWGAVKDVGGALKDQLKKLGKHAIGTIMNPLLWANKKIINGIGWEPPKAPPLFGIKKIEDWVKDSDTDLSKYVDKAKKSGKFDMALTWAKTQVGKPYIWGGVGPSGYDCSGFMSAITNVIAGKPPHSRVGATATFPWGGFKSGFGEGFTIGSSKSYAGGVGHMAGTLNGVNVESRGGRGVIVGAGARGWNDPGFTTHAHYAMKQGGIALANRGPVRALIGDGRYDEAVVPLPKGWRSGLIGPAATEKHYHFYGDLSFPNVTNGDDAKTFLDNLESLAED